MKKRTYAETLYSRLSDIRTEYDDMYTMLQRVCACITAQQDGAKVDWASLRQEINSLAAFQEVRP